MRFKRLAVAGAIALATAGSGLLATSPASASTDRFAESCSSGYACLFYHPNYTGAIYKQYYSDANYGDDYFVTSSSTRGGSGSGLVVRNNAASVDNWDFNNAITIYYSPNYAGVHQRIAAGGQANLIPALRNDNASGKFG
ncbi:peptidase inhibitor family I36 protein [Streptomyces roseoverticillatus]|uniref:peptidase inhibitor family I36 protein n=1 Tax=Streptomyces roseoverticillatus TaxID=66429 RepID=UPI001F32C498|nr:peptidase inhibitor family I36 protein [Streptomyces roseoverticillatus]MCF3100110.1 peptidase inhibitor family I36 protein [Streptomyces roseoverticillatus]